MRRIAVAFLGIVSLVTAQTPSDFSPGSLQKLGISFKKIDISPAVTQVQGLSQVAEVPQVKIPQAALTGPDGQLIPNRKFMIFMIDTDVVRNQLATTVLHWFQPDLMPQGDSLVLFNTPPAPAAPGTPAPKVDIDTPSIILAVNETAARERLRRRQAPVDPNDPPGIGPGQFGTRQQAPYFAPGPPPGPPHRYVQVLFAQPDNFTIPDCFMNIITPPGVTDRSGRVGFDIDQFLRATGTRARPLAGNYFRAQNPTPGPLDVNPTATALRNNKCPAPAATAASSAPAMMMPPQPSAPSPPAMSPPAASASAASSSSAVAAPPPVVASPPPAAPKEAKVRRMSGMKDMS